MLLLWLFVGDSMTPFRPSCFNCSSHDPAPFLGVDVAPTGGAQAHCLAADSRRSELSARQIEDFERQVHEDLRRQAGLAH